MGLGIDELISSLHAHLARSGVAMFRCKNNCASGDSGYAAGLKVDRCRTCLYIAYCVVFTYNVVLFTCILSIYTP